MLSNTFQLSTLRWNLNWSSCVYTSGMVWPGTLSCLPVAHGFLVRPFSSGSLVWSGGWRDERCCVFNLEALRTDNAGRDKERQRARCIHRDTDHISPATRNVGRASRGQLICTNDRKMCYKVSWISAKIFCCKCLLSLGLFFASLFLHSFPEECWRSLSIFFFLLSCHFSHHPNSAAVTELLEV